MNLLDSRNCVFYLEEYWIYCISKNILELVLGGGEVRNNLVLFHFAFSFAGERQSHSESRAHFPDYWAKALSGL